MADIQIPDEVLVQVHGIGENHSISLKNLNSEGLALLIERGFSVLLSNICISAVRKATEDDPQPGNGASWKLCTPKQKEDARHIFKNELMPALVEKILVGDFTPATKSNPKAQAADLFEKLKGKKASREELEEFMTSPVFLRNSAKQNADRQAALVASRAAKRSTDQMVLELEVEDLLANSDMSVMEAVNKVCRTSKSVKNPGELLSRIQESFGV